VQPTIGVKWRGFVWVLFFVSGFSGLVYEVVWARLLGLVFGNSTLAVSTILTTYMLGLALGSYLVGRWVDRVQRPLLVYGSLEFLVGLYCTATPALVQWVQGVHLSFYQHFSPSVGVYALMRLLLCVAVLLFPTVMMGGTLPAITRFMVRSLGQVGGGVGNLYALNTFGAALGAATAGFALIPALGLDSSVFLAAGINLAVGVLAASVSLVSREQARGDAGEALPPAAPPASEEVRELDERTVRKVTWALVIGFGLSGFASLSYEVCWTRVLAMIIGSSVYSFAIVLASFLLGIALGSLIFAGFYARRTVVVEWFAMVEIGIGISALVLIAVFSMLPFAMVRLREALQDVYAGLLTAEMLMCLGILLIPTMLMGATFPIVTALCTRSVGTLGRTVGRLYFFNTLGAIFGSALSGFLLIPLLGVQRTISLMVAINLAVGCLIWVLVSDLRINRVMLQVLWALGVVAAFACPPWDQGAIAGGAFMYSRDRLLMYGVNEVPPDSQAAHLVFYRDGWSCTVAVSRSGDNLSLSVNGKVDASTFVGDMLTQLMSGHLPALFCREQNRAMLIGLGSGVTAKALSLHPFQQVDAVEIEPQVVEAAKEFRRVNGGVLEDPRSKVRIHIDDGRNFVQSTPQLYDVIVSEPSNPWIAGVANLFTVEHYRHCREKLAPGGVLCQWCQTYSMTRDDLLMILRSFLSVFPDATVWMSNVGDLLLLGSRDGQLLAWPEVEKRLRQPALAEDLAYLGIRDPRSLLAYFQLRPEELRALAGEGLLNTDRHPILEFSAPKSLYQETVFSNYQVLARAKKHLIPSLEGLSEAEVETAPLLTEFGYISLRREINQAALDLFERAISLDPLALEAYLGASQALLSLSRPRPLAAWDRLVTAVSIDPSDPRPHYELARLYQSEGMPRQALIQARQALELDPRNETYRQLEEQLAAQQEKETKG